MAPTRLLLVDDNGEVLEELCREPKQEFDIVGTVSNGQDAIDAVVWLARSRRWRLRHVDASPQRRASFARSSRKPSRPKILSFDDPRKRRIRCGGGDLF